MEGQFSSITAISIPDSFMRNMEYLKAQLNLIKMINGQLK